MGFLKNIKLFSLFFVHFLWVKFDFTLQKIEFHQFQKKNVEIFWGKTLFSKVFSSKRLQTYK